MTDVLSELRSVDRRTDRVGRGRGASSGATARPDRPRATLVGTASGASPAPAGTPWVTTAPQATNSPQKTNAPQATALCDDNCPYCWGPESD